MAVLAQDLRARFALGIVADVVLTFELGLNWGNCAAQAGGRKRLPRQAPRAVRTLTGD
jgi:hypothetical protein